MYTDRACTIPYAEGEDDGDIELFVKNKEQCGQYLYLLYNYLNDEKEPFLLVQEEIARRSEMN